MKKLGRFLNRIYAALFGYFWLPCPICGEYFGGHEWKADINAALYTDRGHGNGVCSRCIPEATRRNAILFQLLPPPVRYVNAPEAVVVSDADRRV